VQRAGMSMPYIIFVYPSPGWKTPGEGGADEKIIGADCIGGCGGGRILLLAKKKRR
jgi:hypothetical protein